MRPPPSSWNGPNGRLRPANARLSCPLRQPMLPLAERPGLVSARPLASTARPGNRAKRPDRPIPPAVSRASAPAGGCAAVSLISPLPTRPGRRSSVTSASLLPSCGSVQPTTLAASRAPQAPVAGTQLMPSRAASGPDFSNRPSPRNWPFCHNNGPLACQRPASGARAAGRPRTAAAPTAAGTAALPSLASIMAEALT